MDAPVPDDTGSSLPIPSETIKRLDELGEALPEEKREEFHAIIERTISHAGWLPPPEYLAAYEAILPGLAERIVQMPEREQAYRHRFNADLLGRDDRLKRRGQTFALVAMGLLLGFSALLVAVGEPAWASRVAMATVVGVVGIFVTGRWFDSKAKTKSDDEDEKGD